jgi:hypothetical protein
VKIRVHASVVLDIEFEMTVPDKPEDEDQANYNYRVSTGAIHEAANQMGVNKAKPISVFWETTDQKHQIFGGRTY